MTLETLSQSSRNQMTTGPPKKRARTSGGGGGGGGGLGSDSSTPPPSPPSAPLDELETVDADADADEAEPLLATPERTEAVQKYEGGREVDAETGTYTSSIYVDAFVLALDTVLADEAYLFSEDELEVFVKYRSLPYAAQHLYVRLFLRKTDAWFRIGRLQYPKDIPDVGAACALLQSKDVGFANDDADIALEDAAGLLLVEELKAVTKDAKCAVTGSNKPQLIAGLMKASREQAGLRARGGQLKLQFDGKGNYVNREEHFVKKILERTGPCIRLSSAVTVLFNRVHLVFYRSTEWTEKSLTTVILSRTMKRNFPHYIVSRTSNIFPTRQALLDFEASIKLQSEVDEILVTPGAPGEEGLQRVHEIFEATYPIWEQLVAAEAESTLAAEHDEALERVYLRRFNAGWVYTRIAHKGVYVLGRFKLYEREHSVLSALLSQKFFQPARRGVWYQRKALIEENYMSDLDGDSKAPKEARIKKWRKAALSTCEAGLQDPQTHLIFHYDLQKRILKLEHKLRVPKRMQHDFGHARLRKPSDRTIFGERLNEPELGRKTLWRDPEDGLAECSVEEMCLSVYRSEGWKGYHCEGGIVRTLFAYLFYDMLFLYLPNVFETEFQTCPLDLFTDAFYPVRASEINHRLAEIANGGARRIVKEVWENNQERQPCVVGLNWSYSIEDLEEIVECFPPDALATVCKVLCQEYRQRGGGMPDLFLWRYGEGDDPVKEVLFSEVKSENDRLSDTQRLWIHVLSSAGVAVELCAARSKRKNESQAD